MNHELIVILHLLQESRYNARYRMCNRVNKLTYCIGWDCPYCLLAIGQENREKRYPNLIIKTSQTISK